MICSSFEMKCDRDDAANHLWPIEQETERGKIARWVIERKNLATLKPLLSAPVMRPSHHRERFMSNANIALVQSLYAAFGRGDIATIVSAAAPDVVWHVHGRPKDYPALGVHKGPQGVKKFFEIVADTQDVSSFTPREFYPSGDKVFVRGHYAWTMRKTGKSVSMEWLHMFTVRDGKLAAFDEFTDTAQFAEAVR
jgi:ketosteroid isomerase-like protein